MKLLLPKIEHFFLSLGFINLYCENIHILLDKNSTGKINVNLI